MHARSSIIKLLQNYECRYLFTLGSTSSCNEPESPTGSMQQRLLVMEVNSAVGYYGTRNIFACLSVFLIPKSLTQQTNILTSNNLYLRVIVIIQATVLVVLMDWHGFVPQSPLQSMG